MARVNKLLAGNRPDVINSNITTLKNAGYSHASATRCAMCHANKKYSSVVKKVSAKITKAPTVGVKLKGPRGFNA